MRRRGDVVLPLACLCAALVASSGATATPSRGRAVPSPQAVAPRATAPTPSPVESTEAVSVWVHAAALREHAAMARFLPLLLAIDAVRNEDVPIDPSRDVEWVLVRGPSLLRLERDWTVVRYKNPDRAVDEALARAVKAKHATPFRTGVPNVRGFALTPARGGYVVLRPAKQTLVAVSPDRAREVAASLARSPAAFSGAPDRLLEAKVRNPRQQLPFMPEALSELRVTVTSTPEGGALLVGEGETPGHEAACNAADALRAWVMQTNTLAVRLLTRGLLSRVDVVTDGAKVRIRVPATREQIEALAVLVFPDGDAPPENEPLPPVARETP
jgi:hypothetical protein